MLFVVEILTENGTILMDRCFVLFCYINPMNKHTICDVLSMCGLKHAILQLLYQQIKNSDKRRNRFQLFNFPVWNEASFHVLSLTIFWLMPDYAAQSNLGSRLTGPQTIGICHHGNIMGVCWHILTCAGWGIGSQTSGHIHWLQGNRKQHLATRIHTL